MVEIELKRHGHQSKIELPRIPYMTYVVFFRIYRQFPSNRNHLQCHNMNIYGYFCGKSKKHQSKNLMSGRIFFKKKFTDPKPIICFTSKKFYRA